MLENLKQGKPFSPLFAGQSHMASIIEKTEDSWESNHQIQVKPDLSRFQQQIITNLQSSAEEDKVIKRRTVDIGVGDVIKSKSQAIQCSIDQAAQNEAELLLLTFNQNLQTAADPP